MKELQINLPSVLSEEENKLKEMQEKLRTLRKIIEKRSASGGDPSKIDKNRSKKSIEEAEVATEEVRKKIQAGAITVRKKDEKSTFKRAKPIGRRTESTRSESLAGEEDGEIVDNDYALSPPPIQPKLMSPTKSTPSQITSIAPSTSHWVGREMENRGKRIYIRGYDLQSESLTSEFSKFGKIERVTVIDRQRSAFITFETIQQAEHAIREMDGNMVNGITIRVSFAHRQHEPGERREGDGNNKRRESESRPNQERRDDRKRSEHAPKEDSNDESPNKTRKIISYSEDSIFDNVESVSP